MVTVKRMGSFTTAEVLSTLNVADNAFMIVIVTVLLLTMTGCRLMVIHELWLYIRI